MAEWVEIINYRLRCQAYQAGAEFIRLTGIPHYPNEVLKLDDFTTDSTLGRIYSGGISSTSVNIFSPLRERKAVPVMDFGDMSCTNRRY